MPRCNVRKLKKRPKLVVIKNKMPKSKVIPSFPRAISKDEEEYFHGKKTKKED